MRNLLTIGLTLLTAIFSGCTANEKEKLSQVVKEEMRAVEDLRTRRKEEVQKTLNAFQSFSFLSEEEKKKTPSNSQEIINEVRTRRMHRFAKLEAEVKARGEFLTDHQLMDLDSKTAEYQEEQELLRYAYGGRLPFE